MLFLDLHVCISDIPNEIAGYRWAELVNGSHVFGCLSLCE